VSGMMQSRPVIKLYSIIQASATTRLETSRDRRLRLNKKKRILKDALSN